MALLRALFLVIGPLLSTMRLFLSKIRSITTDCGSELHLITTPDILNVFFLWMNGVYLERMVATVSPLTRLMPRALRIGGWSHMMSNLMKNLIISCSKWPRILLYLRALCRFFRNVSYREHLTTAFANVDGVNVKLLFKSFKGTFAKWRFETLFDVLTSLQTLSSFCRTHMDKHVFQNVKDAETLKLVLEACNWPHLWSWIDAALRYIVGPLEMARRWGLVCSCCEHLRRLGRRNIKCPQASRKLHLAFDFIKSQANALRQASRGVIECDFVPWIIVEMRHLLILGSSWLHLRFRYLTLIPWLFAKSDVPSVAQECLKQIDSKPLDQHESLTVFWATELRQDLEATARGEDASARQQLEILALRNCPIDESPGEGVHRGTHLVKQNGPASKLPHIKSSVRFKQNLARVRGFVKEHGKRGRAVIAFEWRRYKRLLQVKQSRLKRSVRMTDRAFFQRVYRMDDRPLGKFSKTVQASAPRAQPDATDSQRIQSEYIEEILKPKSHYSLPVTKTNTDENGAAVSEEEIVYFTVLEKRTRKARPVLVRHHDSINEVCLEARLSFLIQYMSAIQSPVSDGAPVTCYHDSDPEWVVDVAPFRVLSSQLRIWKCDASDVFGCITLSSPSSAEPQMALADQSIPSYMVLKALKELGWKPTGMRVKHTADAVEMLMDIRKAYSKKFYYQGFRFEEKAWKPNTKGVETKHQTQCSGRLVWAIYSTIVRAPVWSFFQSGLECPRQDITGNP